MFDSGLCNWLVLLPPTPTTQFSLDHKRWSQKQNRKKWKRSDSSDSNSAELKTPLPTPIFDFQQVISSLMTPTTTPTQKRCPSCLCRRLIYIILLLIYSGSQSSQHSSNGRRVYWKLSQENKPFDHSRRRLASFWSRGRNRRYCYGK